MARAEARDCTMRLLYGRELGGEGVETSIEELMDLRLSQEDLAYVRGVLDGTEQKQEEVDALIEQYAIGWSLGRIAKVDLSILRLALYEMLYREDVPTSVAINEAVELSHVYSTPEAASFINGILGSVARSLEEAKP